MVYKDNGFRKRANFDQVEEYTCSSMQASLSLVLCNALLSLGLCNANVTLLFPLILPFRFIYWSILLLLWQVVL